MHRLFCNGPSRRTDMVLGIVELVVMDSQGHRVRADTHFPMSRCRGHKVGRVIGFFEEFDWLVACTRKPVVCTRE